MTNESVQLLQHISDQLNRYFALWIFIFGTIGNMLNCFVLSKRTLQANPCAFLFLVSSYIDLISILIGVPTRILASWQLDPTNTIDWICKLRAFTVFSTRTMAIWLITYATIDRWLISSVNIHRRQMSSMRNTKRAIFIIIILSIVAFIHMLPCYEANNTDAPLKCYEKSEECRLVTDGAYIMVTIMIPSIIMLTFGILTVSNIRSLQSRVQHAANTASSTNQNKRMTWKSKKTDHHLLRMLLLQVFLIILLCTPQAIQKTYMTFKPFGSGSELDDAIKAFLYNIELLLAFVASGMPFYIYTLAGGSVFRNVFLNLMQNFKRKLACRHN